MSQLWSDSWSSKNLLLAAAGVGVGSLALSYGLRSFRTHLREKKFKARIQQRRDAREKQFGSLKKRLSSLGPEEQERWPLIIKMKFPELLEALQREEFSPGEVLHAFQNQALLAQEATNCLCIFIEEAETWAGTLHAKFHGKTKPPLYGIPFSLKENLKMKGYDNTIGFVRRLDEPATEDSCLVSCLRDLGAIPFVHTNLPQSMDSWICSNPIYGLTTHPGGDKTRTPGGSTGGEAALLALGGSPFGLGGDIGGSIRLPAHWSGISGIRPTSIRMTRLGAVGLAPGIVMLAGSSGPMAPDVETLVHVLRQVWAPSSPMFQNDPLITPLFFQEDLFQSTQPLTIGYYVSDPACEATPACQRAVLEAKALLESSGHNLVQWTLPPVTEQAWAMATGACDFDGGKPFVQGLLKDLPEPLNMAYFDYKVKSRWWNYFNAFLTNDPDRKKVLAWIPQSPSKLRALHNKILDVRQEFTKSWRAAGLDCLLGPPNAAAALPHKVAMSLYSAYNYTILYNLLDFPGCVTSVTQVSPEDVRKMADYPVSDKAGQLLKNACSADSVGLPVGVQCVALPNRDEICLRVANEIDKCVQKLSSTGPVSD